MEILEANTLYHVYNHANGSDLLFNENENYHFFLSKYKQHILPIASTLAFCLMPNHFHLLVHINQPIPVAIKENHYSKYFSNSFSSYAQSFNKKYQRSGSLFQKNFRRKKVDSKEYALKLINYIHFNPVHHGFTHRPELWKYSSYNAILKQHNTSIDYKQVLELFGGVNNFEYMHQNPMDFSFDY